MRRLYLAVFSVFIILACCAVALRTQSLDGRVAAAPRLSSSLMVAAGGQFNCAVLTNGTLKCWGQNTYGQLGLGNTNNYGDNPDEVGTGLPAVDVGQTVKYVATGVSTSCAIRTNNETVCWGYAGDYLLANGGTGTVGDASGEMGSALTPIDFGTSYALSIDIGSNHGCALLADGDVKCWGTNTYGELGVNGNIHSTEQMGINWPSVDLGSGRTALAMTTGDYHTCVILDTNAVACWGFGSFGQLGYGSTANRGYADLGSALTTVNLGDGRTATAIAAGGYFTCAILDDGSVKCWGLNIEGQLGQNSTTWLGDNANEMGEYLLPVYLGNDRTAKQIVANNSSVCVILDNNTLKCWGNNFRGQLGTGDTNNRGDDAGEMSTLGTVNLGTGQIPAQIAVGNYHVCVMLISMNLKCWGYGYQGQLGRGTNLSYGSSSSDMGDSLPLIDFDGVTPTVTNTPAETDTPTQSNTPTQTQTPTQTNTPTATRTASKTLTSSKTKTKTKTPTSSKTPTSTPIGYVSRVAAVTSGYSHSCAILASSVVKCWGWNEFGQLGLGDSATRGDASGEMGNALPQVNLGTGVIASKIYAGATHTCAITTTGRVKCWGSNALGELGLGDTNNRGDASSEMADNLSYVDLGTDRTAVSLSLGELFSCALLDNATVVCWGRNDFGQLGNGSTDNIGDAPGEMGDSLVPVDVGTDHTVVSMVNHQYGICALLDNASIKCWGLNSVGQLGIGDTVNRGDGVGLMGDNLPVVPFSADLTPVELAGVTGATCARFDDGTVRCWGLNLFGELGTGDALDRGDSPGEIAALAAIDLGSGHTAKRIFGENGFSFCALLDDDSLKCWGDNSDANLGIGISTIDTLWGNATGEMGDNLPAIDLGTGVNVSTLSIGEGFRCAIMKSSTAVKCWGKNNYGQLGIESTYAAWGEYPDATMGDFLPYIRLGSIIPSTLTPTKTATQTLTLTPSLTKTLTKTPTKTLTKTRTKTSTKTPTKTLTKTRTKTRTKTP